MKLMSIKTPFRESLSFSEHHLAHVCVINCNCSLECQSNQSSTLYVTTFVKVNNIFRSEITSDVRIFCGNDSKSGILEDFVK